MSKYTRADKLRGLQKMVNFLEVHTEIKLPDLDLPIYFFGESKEEAKKIAQAFGTFKKSEVDTYLTLTKKFGSITLRAIFTRSAVCTKRVVGTHKVMKSVYPESVIPAQVEVTEDIIEWDCHSLLDPYSQAEAYKEAVEDVEEPPSEDPIEPIEEAKQ